MAVACIDVGTNTALLLITEIGSDGRLHPLYDEQRFVRLGEGVDGSGYIRSEAMERLRRVLLQYLQIAERRDVKDIIVAGTSASRDARNRDDLVAFVYEKTGLVYEVLSGDEEAKWTFAGAVSAFEEVPGPAMVVDVGGGSTEVIIGEFASGSDTRPVLRYQTSLDIGAVRLTERLFSSLPPAREEVEEMERTVLQAVEAAGVPDDREISFIAAAGTASALALVHRGIETWDESLAVPVTLFPEEIRTWRKRLLSLTFDEVLAINSPVLSGRADVFPAGVLILETIFRRVGAKSCQISPRGLRHGLALRYASKVNARRQVSCGSGRI